MLSFGVCHADKPVLKSVHGDFTHPKRRFGKAEPTNHSECIFTLPNEDLGRSTNLSDLSELRFRSTFHGREYRIWATQR